MVSIWLKKGMDIFMNIILIGYMGCGKTTVGKNLAKMLEYEFVDTDEAIEQQQGRTISDIFAQEGEKTFRNMETDYLKNLIKEKADRLVISTGGGMSIREENQELLKQLGLVVYLRVKPQTVYERVKGDTKRPLLQCDDPFTKIKNMLEERGPVYKSTAHHIIDVDELRQQEIAEKIMDWI